jgi:hypothetical protein
MSVVLLTRNASMNSVEMKKFSRRANPDESDYRRCEITLYFSGKRLPGVRVPDGGTYACK